MFSLLDLQPVLCGLILCGRVEFAACSISSGLSKRRVHVADSTRRAQLAAVDAAKPDVSKTGTGTAPLTDMAFSAEAHLPFCEVWVADGSVRVSEDIRQVMI